MPIHLGFVVEKVAMKQVFLPVLWFFPVWITDQCFTHTSSLINAMYSSQLTELLCNALKNHDTLYFEKDFEILPTSDRCSSTETLLHMIHRIHNKQHELLLYPQPKRIHCKVKR
jgi:hypothetical protein